MEIYTTIKTQLHSWLTILKIHGSLFSVLTTKSDEGKAIFDYPCDAKEMDIVRMMLHHCDRVQRRQLVQSYQINGLEEEKKKQDLELKELIMLCDRIDVLLDLKAELDAPSQSRSGFSLFFNSLPPDLESLKVILKDIDKDSCVFIEPNKLSEIWENVKEMLPAAEPQAELSQGLRVKL